MSLLEKKLIKTFRKFIRKFSLPLCFLNTNIWQFRNRPYAFTYVPIHLVLHSRRNQKRLIKIPCEIMYIICTLNYFIQGFKQKKI